MRSLRYARLRIVLALAALCLSTTVAMPARAQDSASLPATQRAAASASAQVQPSTVAAAQPNGLPTEPAPPRTLRAYWHVWIAFTLAWLLLFGYVVSVGRRFGKVERELEAMGG